MILGQLRIGARQAKNALPAQNIEKEKIQKMDFLFRESKAGNKSHPKCHIPIWVPLAQ